jgi:hypothetical protein
MYSQEELIASDGSLLELPQQCLNKVALHLWEDGRDLIRFAATCKALVSFGLDPRVWHEAVCKRFGPSVLPAMKLSEGENLIYAQVVVHGPQLKHSSGSSSSSSNFIIIISSSSSMRNNLCMVNICSYALLDLDRICPVSCTMICAGFPVHHMHVTTFFFLATCFLLSREHQAKTPGGMGFLPRARWKHWRRRGCTCRGQGRQTTSG